MEAAVLLGILGIGYLLKNDTNDNNDQGQLVLPLETDAYKSDYFEENDKEYKAKIFENYDNAMDYCLEINNNNMSVER